MKLGKISGILLFIGILALIFHFISCQKLDFNEVTKCNIGKLSAVNATTLNLELNVIELSPTNHPDFGICYSNVNENPTITDSIVSLGSVNENNLYKMNIEKLFPGTKYYFRGYIMNGNETKYSLNLKEFVTPELPVAETLASSNVLMNQATLNGNVNAKNISSKVTFEYGTTASYGMEVTSQQSPVVGNLDVNISTEITGLLAVTTYHYRIKAVSMAGITYGNDLTFTTTNIPPPSVTTNIATNISTTQAKLNGSVNAYGQNTIVSFEYGATTSYGNNVIPNQSPVSGSVNTTVSSDVSGLLKNTLYHFRVKASSIGGTIYGDDLTFTTLSIIAPIALTNAASNLTFNSATINGMVNANDQSTNVSFEFGTTSSYGITANASPSTLTGSTATSVNANIIGLTANTLYHFRVKAVSDNGTVYGDELTFTTSPIPSPSASTTSATNIAITTATINGKVNANGQSTAVSFEYGTTTNYGSIASASPGTLAGSAATSVIANITGLAANTLYHFRVKAISAGGTVYGSDLTFTTNIIPAPTASSSAATNIIITSANINGAVNANGQIATVTFEYGITTSYGSTAFASVGTVSGSIAVNVSTNITGLTASTLYHFRVKAVSAGGTAYGNDVTFRTAESIDGTVTDIDGNVYDAIIIGTQVWMRENLKTTKYNDGTAITLVTDNIAWQTAVAAYCWYNNDAATYRATYGALYNWNVIDPASDGNKNICPTGWHVPTDEELTILITLFGGEYLAGGKLKEAGIAHWKSSSSEADNSSGFTALPSGFRGESFGGIGYNGSWWSCTESSATSAWNRYIVDQSNSAQRYMGLKYAGRSVRCIRD